MNHAAEDTDDTEDTKGKTIVPGVRASRRFSEDAAAPDPKRVWIAVAVLIAAVWGAAATMDLLYINGKLHDLFIPLDVGWRLEQGQRPHVDFHSPLGSFYYFLCWLGVKIAGPHPMAIAWTTLIGGAAVSLLAASLSAKRLPPTWALLIGVYIAMFCLTPRHMEFSPAVVTWIAVYNRWGWGLFSCCALALCLPGGGRRSDLLRGLACAAAMTALLWIKATYAIGAAAGAMATFLLFPEARKRSAWALCAFAVLAAAGLATPLGQSYVADLLEAARIAPTAKRPFNALEIAEIWINLPFLLISLALLGLHAAGRRAGGDGRGKGIPATLSWMAAGVAITPQNGESCVGSLPVLTAILYLQAVEGGIFTGAAARARRWLQILCAAFSILISLADFLCVSVAHGDGKEIGAAEGRIEAFGIAIDLTTARGGASRIMKIAAEERIANPRSDEKWVQRDVSSYDQAALIEDGIRVLNRFARPGERVLSMTFSNPFPILRGEPSPIGGPLWWDKIRTYNETRHPASSAAFGGVDLLMVPKFAYDWPQADYFRNFYKSEMMVLFETVEDGPYWTLMRKRKNPDYAAADAARGEPKEPPPMEGVWHRDGEGKDGGAGTGPAP